MEAPGDEALGISVGAPATGGLAIAPLTLEALPDFAPIVGSMPYPERSPERVRPSTKVLKAQAQERREMLQGLLDRMIQGGRPTREEAIDAVLAVIEDAHSSDPVLFGADAAGHFARLHEARSAPRC